MWFSFLSKKFSHGKHIWDERLEYNPHKPLRLKDDNIYFHFLCPDAIILSRISTYIYTFRYRFNLSRGLHKCHSDWNGQIELLWLYQSTLCQYLSFTAWGLALRATIPFRTIEHGTRLTVSWLIWSPVTKLWGDLWQLRGSWPTYCSNPLIWAHSMAVYCTFRTVCNPNTTVLHFALFPTY